MKGMLVVTGLLSLTLLSGGGNALAQDAADDELATPTGIMQQRANDVALVLASDPRFADLTDYETLRRDGVLLLLPGQPDLLDRLGHLLDLDLFLTTIFQLTVKDSEFSFSTKLTRQVSSPKSKMKSSTAKRLVSY